MVQDTIGDVDGLHCKLDRKSQVEASNLSAATALKSSMQSAVSALCLSLQEHSQAQLQTCTDFTSKISA